MMARRKRKRLKPGGPTDVMCRHPLTEITAAVRALWDADKRMASPVSEAEERQANNTFDIVLDGLLREVNRMIAWRVAGKYTTVQG